MSLIIADISWFEVFDAIGFFLRSFAVPLVTLVAVAVSLFVAYRRGLFARADLASPPETRIVVEGDVVASSVAAGATEIGLDTSKVDEYHQQSIAQSRTSFWFSLIFASLGFLIIAMSVFNYSDQAGYLGVVAGTVIDAIAALFFYQSNRARQLMAEFFDRLRPDRRIIESLKLCSEIDDVRMRNSLRAKLSLHFAGLVETNESLRLIVGHGPDTAESSTDDP